MWFSKSAAFPKANWDVAVQSGTLGSMLLSFPAGASRFRCRNIFFLTPFLALATANAYAVDTRIIALTNAPAPLGPPSGYAQFTSFGSPVIDQHANVFFSAPTSSFGFQGVWKANTSDPLPIAFTQTSDELGPHIPGKTFGGFDTYVAGANNRLAFRASLQGNAPGTIGIWLAGISEEPTPVARQSTDGLLGPHLGAGIVFKEPFLPSRDDFGWPVLNDAGKIAFVGFLSGDGINSTNDRGIWITEASSGPIAAARFGNDGSLGPGLGSGVVFGNFFTPTLTGSNDLFFDAQLAGDGRTGVWHVSSGSPVPIALSQTDGALGPGLGPGISYSFLAGSTVNSSNVVVLSAGLQGGGFNPNTNDGIWTIDGSNRNIHALAGASGALGPNLGDGSLFQFVNSASINQSGHLAFKGGLADLRSGIWINDTSMNHAIALSGTDGPLGPGLGPGVRFDSFSLFSYFNDADQVAFTATLARPPGSGITTANDDGLWFASNGIIHLIAREGDFVDVNPSAAQDLRRIVAIALVNEGRPRPLNNQGDLVYRLTFADGSQGVFVASVAVPEPASCLIALAMLSYLSMFRWKLRRPTRR
jgi:hypothetical protein